LEIGISAESNLVIVISLDFRLTATGEISVSNISIGDRLFNGF